MALLLKVSQFLFSVKNQNIQKAEKLWGYVAIAFNKVDYDRLKLVGADRLCAEWVLKNGGAVSSTAVPDRYFKDYNALPAENVRFNIKEVDASNSSIMKIGFEHFKDCKYIDKIILHNCKHLEDDSLDGLQWVKDSLKYLQVSGCYNINDKGLLPIKDLINLKYLNIFDMPYVRNLEAMVKEIKVSLPKCEVDAAK